MTSIFSWNRSFGTKTSLSFTTQISILEFCNLRTDETVVLYALIIVPPFLLFSDLYKRNMLDFSLLKKKELMFKHYFIHELCHFRVNFGGGAVIKITLHFCFLLFLSFSSSTYILFFHSSTILHLLGILFNKIWHILFFYFYFLIYFKRICVFFSLIAVVDYFIYRWSFP